jgi:UDP-N-acetylmuramoylalanine--D-glutamate ligase
MTSELSGKRVVVFGLAKSGLSAIKLLQAHDAKVIAVDEKPREALGALASELESRGVTLALGPVQASRLTSADLVVVSPGVPLALPVLQAARDAGVPVWGEVELASRCFGPGPVVGITGTNGKSTTTALTGHIFNLAMPSFVGGNLGLPLSEAVLPGAGPWAAYVVELSSFQLEGISTMRLNGAAILNLTPDHLDRYPSHDAYGLAKARIFGHQQAGDFAVVNVDDAGVMKLAAHAKAELYGFSAAGTAKADRIAAIAVPSRNGFTFRNERFTVTNRALRGTHNLENAMAATILARLSGIESAEIQKGLDTYPGLPHRLESVRVLDGVEWINDSKATNVESTLVALKAFPGGLWLVAGGKGKGAPYAPMVEASKGKVKGVLAIGSDAEAISEAYRGKAEVISCGTLDAAVKKARELARSGDTVLLSPACASYDQFKNFEDRGDTFKRLVRAL